MSDTFYGLECLMREQARAIEREAQRRRLLALARERHRRPIFGKRFNGVVTGMRQRGRFLPGYTKAEPEGCGPGACRR